MDSRTGMVPNVSDVVELSGFAVIPQCLSDETVSDLCAHFGDKQESRRNLLSDPIVRELAASKSVRQFAEAVLGPRCFAARGIFFNKTEQANWKVPWHQDLTIAVRERRNVRGFGPWTVKEGSFHVQPPTEILRQMIAIRLHIDESQLDNGPLRVIPRSHAQGRLSAEQIADWDKGESVTCTVSRGGALVMRPLILHASTACLSAKPRRVIHLEFALGDLPHGLEWCDRVC